MLKRCIAVARCPPYDSAVGEWKAVIAPKDFKSLMRGDLVYFDTGIVPKVDEAAAFGFIKTATIGSGVTKAAGRSGQRMTSLIWKVRLKASIKSCFSPPVQLAHKKA